MRRHTVRLKDLSARDVVAKAESLKVGNVTDVLFAPRDGEIAVVLFESSGGLGGLVREHHAVMRSNLIAIGADAVIVRDRGGVIAKPDTIDRTGLVSAAHLKGRDVVTDAGEKIGQVLDFDLIPEEGRLVNYIVRPTKGGGLLGVGADHPQGERIIPLQADVVVGPEIITVPASLLRRGPGGDTPPSSEGMTRGPGLEERSRDATAATDRTRVDREES